MLCVDGHMGSGQQLLANQLGHVMIRHRAIGLCTVTIMVMTNVAIQYLFGKIATIMAT